MENLLRNGDYVPDGFGAFTRTQELQELLQRALFRLQCRRGSFPFLPELGSRLYELGKEKPSVRDALARQYAAQALEGMELRVADASVTATADDHAGVRIELDYCGQKTSVEVTI